MLRATLTNYEGLLLKPPTPCGAKSVFRGACKYLIAFFTSCILINIKLPTLVLTKASFVVKDNPLCTMLYKIVKGEPLRYFLNLSSRMSFCFSNTSPRRELICPRVRHFPPY